MKTRRIAFALFVLAANQRAIPEADSTQLATLAATLCVHRKLGNSPGRPSESAPTSWCRGGAAAVLVRAWLPGPSVYNNRILYNRKRHGTFDLGGRV